ncbi:MAG TPA: metallophosphoesterase, partial [Thermoanaerobaculia bacterium]|nr:metallophosphoesterase [Thermoanaerobaculia bacterium]
MRFYLRAIALLLAFPLYLSAANTQITILQTTDIHDHANGSDHTGLDVDPQTATGATGAYSRIAAYINSVRRTTHHPVLLVDSGDWTMGTLYDATLVDPRIDVPLALLFMDYMHYDAVTLGNHEFDYGPGGLARMFKTARNTFGFHTPIVASNMSLNGNTDLAPYVGPGNLIDSSRIIRVNGVNVGFIGLMGEAAATDAASSAPVTFSKLSAHYADFQSLVDSMRANGAQLIIALSHSGTDPSGTSGEDVDLARHVHGIDVIASGHTHTPLPSVHAIANGTWTTQIIDAGAYGTNVARLDITYNSTAKTTTVNAYNNMPMTDAALLATGVAQDDGWRRIVQFTDVQLNGAFGPLFKTIFTDYSAPAIGTGVYHPVATTAQDMVSNSSNAVAAPNGLGDLTADAQRNTANGILAKVPPNIAGFDYTPFQVGAVATGVLRTKLRTGVPITFADLYGVVPLGITPDLTQALPIGYPMISLYLDAGDLKQVAALQLVAQSALVNSDFYLNLSGVQYSLKPDETKAYFKSATAAAVLQIVSAKAAAGSTAALQALGALQSNPASLPTLGATNPYAAA